MSNVAVETVLHVNRGGRRNFHNAHRLTWCTRMSVGAATLGQLGRGSRRMSDKISLLYILEKQAAPFTRGARSTGRE